MNASVKRPSSDARGIVPSRFFAHVSRPATLLAWGALALALLAILLAAVVRAGAPATSTASALVGRPLPQVALPEEQGGRVVGTRPLLPGEGRPALVLFVYSLCPRCLAEAVAVSALARQHGLDLVVVDSPAETSAIADAYATRLGLSGGSILLDRSGALAVRLGISAYPTLLLVDARGTVRKVWVGETSQQAISAAITSLTAHAMWRDQHEQGIGAGL